MIYGIEWELIAAVVLISLMKAVVATEKWRMDNNDKKNKADKL